MSHDDPMDLERVHPEEMAALYRLGLLTPEEAGEFQTSLAHDRARLEGLREAGELSVALAMGAPGGGPRPELRAKLMERIRRERGAGLGAVLSTEGAWRETGIAGVSLKPLYLDQASGLMTMLVRMQPGAIYPAHTHSRTEQCLVLEGDLRHGDHVYGPGDFTWAEAGSVDPALHTVQGNLLLIIAAAENRV